MQIPMPDEPLYWVLTITIWLLGVVVTLLLAYLVIRLAITHGMLSYSRQLEEQRRLPVYRN